MRSQLGDTLTAVDLFSWERRKLVGSPLHSAFVQPCITLLSFNHLAANLFAQITCYFQGRHISKRGILGSQGHEQF